MSNRNMQKTKKEDFWKSYPDVIERLYKSALSDDGNHTVLETISFLKDNKVKKDERNGLAKMDYIRFTDRFFRGLCCLFPVDVFTDHSDELLDILGCANEYLHDLCDFDTVSNMPRIETGYRDEYDLVNTIQYFDYYYLNLYFYSDQFDKAKAKLDKLLMETKINAKYMLSQKDAMDYAEIDCYGLDGLELECVYWQPLMWVRQNVSYDWLYDPDVPDKIKPELIRAFEDYLQFLKEIPLEYYSACKARSNLVFHTAVELQEMLEFAMELMEDEGIIGSQIYGCSYDEMGSRVKELEELKAAYGEEKNEGTHINLTEAAPHYTEKEDMHKAEFLDNNEGYYHRTFGKMTEALKERMRDYPDLPVVVLPDGDPSNSKGNIILTPECCIGHVHDPDSGEFLEKIIAIYVNKSPVGVIDDLFLTEDELPF